MTNIEHGAKAGCGFVEVLTQNGSGAVLGYHMKGASPGPHVVVAGLCIAVEEVFGRFVRIPTLPWMRGTLTLLKLDQFDTALRDGTVADTIGRVDRTVVLPLFAEADDYLTLRKSYHGVLSICAGLGMIQGRGVARTRPTAVG